MNYDIEATDDGVLPALERYIEVRTRIEREDGDWVTVLLYAGDGLFRYEEDIMNVSHCVEDIVESGWVPGPGFNPPPERPDRNFDPAPIR